MLRMAFCVFPMYACTFLLSATGISVIKLVVRAKLKVICDLEAMVIDASSA